ncbi:MAG TPA: hypothetical protein DCY89_08920 [Gammaproteobacteria bacterium]|nr:hypothetical protein [Gammaproteobacteria bacterium]
MTVAVPSGCGRAALLAALCLSGARALAAVGAADHHPGATAHPWPGGRLEISIPTDEPKVAGTVDIVLMEGELPVVRLSTRRPGPLLESHLTDLDRDRATELLLIYADAAGRPALVEAWEWQARRHAFRRLDLPAIESRKPLGEGRFRLDGETLTFSARPIEGGGEPMTWNYDGDDARWERRRRFWPW